MQYNSGAPYAPPPRNPGRTPGGLIAIGVISVLLGLLAIIVNFLALPDLQTAYKRSIPPPPPPPPVPYAPVNVPPYDGDVVGEGGLPVETRRAVVKAVDQRLKLSPDRAMMLEWFLADEGRNMFGPISSDPAAIDRLMTDFAAASQSLSGDGPDSFSTAQGHVQIYDSLVHFRNTVGEETVLDGNVLKLPNRSTRWSSWALKEQAERWRTDRGSYGTPISPQQVTVLLKHLAEIPTEPMYGQSRRSFSPIPLQQATVDLGGLGRPYVSINTSSAGRVRILADGRELLESQFPDGADRITGLPIQRPPPTFKPDMPGSLAIIRIMPYEAMVNVALGLMLLLAGIMTLIGMGGAAQVNRLWAYLRLLVGATSLVLGVVYLKSLPGTVSRDDAVGTMFGISLSLIYCVVVLLVHNSKSVRDYFAFHKQSNGLLSEAFRRRWQTFIASPLGSIGLLAVLVVGLLAAALHGHAMSNGSDEDNVSHALLFTLAIAAIVFAGGHLLAMLLFKPRPAVAAIAAAILLFAAITSPASGQTVRQGMLGPPTTKPAAAPEAEQVERATALMKEVETWPEHLQGQEYLKHLGDLHELLALGPHAERITYEALPKASTGHRMLICTGLNNFYRKYKSDIAPEANAAAIKAIPAVVDSFRFNWSPNHAVGALTRKVATIKGAGPVLVGEFIKAGCPGDKMNEILKDTPAAAEGGDTLQIVLNNPAAKIEQRRDALTGISNAGEEGRKIVRSVADGTYPTIADTNKPLDNASRGTKAELRYSEQVSLRRQAIFLIAPQGKKNEIGAEDIAALKGAFKSGNRELRSSALNAWQYGGRAALAALIDYFRDEATSDELPDVAREIGNTIGYPHTLNDEPEFAAPAHRAAAAKLMTFLAQYFEPGWGMKNHERGADELLKMAAGEDQELARQAVTLLATNQKLRAAVGEERLAALTESKSPKLTEAAMKATLRNSSRSVPQEKLLELLSSSDSELRELASRRLFNTSKRIEPKSKLLALLDSRDRNLKMSVARYLRTSVYNNELGPVTQAKITSIQGYGDESNAPQVSSDRVAWPASTIVAAAPPPAPVITTPPPTVGPWPAGYATVAALVGVLVQVVVAAMRADAEPVVSSTASE